MRKNKTQKILNNIVLIGIILTLLILLILPLALTSALKTDVVSMNNNLPVKLTIAIYLCAIPYVYALVLLKKLCKLVAAKQPFAHKIPNILKKISICAFSEVILFNGANIAMYYLCNVYLYLVTIVSCIIVSFVAIAIGFMSLVLSNLFEMAIEIKDENDKTI